MTCRGICEQLAIPMSRNSIGHIYDGTKKWCTKCERWLSYVNREFYCPCCGWMCRTKPIRWRVRRLDTRVRIS